MIPLTLKIAEIRCIDLHKDRFHQKKQMLHHLSSAAYFFFCYTFQAAAPPPVFSVTSADV